jgi:hypothetical protein
MAVTRWRGNAVSTRQRRVRKYGTLARPDWVPTLARGNQKKKRKKTKGPSRKSLIV